MKGRRERRKEQRREDKEGGGGGNLLKSIAYPPILKNAIEKQDAKSTQGEGCK